MTDLVARVARGFVLFRLKETTVSEITPTAVAKEASLRILHISDTHGLHRQIEAKFPFPAADILLHTGDYSNKGGTKEHADFNAWLGELKPRFKHIVVIGGNHEYGSGATVAAMIDPQCVARLPLQLDFHLGLAFKSN
jgi:predicted MPP superfamily phosphohydrolase